MNEKTKSTKTPVNMEDPKNVARLIENGQYYKDARDWYSQMFLYPVTERALMLVVCLLVMFALLIMYTSIRSLYPLNSQLPFAIFSSWNSDEYYPELKKLADTMIDSEKVLKDYFIVNYVKDREEYSPPVDDVQTKINQNRHSRIRQQSNKRVQRTYNELIDIYNSNSPYQIYGYDTTRRILDDTIIVNYDKENPGLAVVNFTTEERKGTKSKKTNWEATIAFSLTDINVVLDTETELKLVVREYDVIRVQ